VDACDKTKLRCFRAVLGSLAYYGYRACLKIFMSKSCCSQSQRLAGSMCLRPCSDASCYTVDRLPGTNYLYTHSYLYNSVIVSIQTQDSPVHYIICCPSGLVTMYGAPELWL